MTGDSTNHGYVYCLFILLQNIEKWLSIFFGSQHTIIYHKFLGHTHVLDNNNFRYAPRHPAVLELYSVQYKVYAYAGKLYTLPYSIL